MYESVDQEKPVYDAKGIETVRRDGCPAVSKVCYDVQSLCFCYFIYRIFFYDFRFWKEV